MTVVKNTKPEQSLQVWGHDDNFKLKWCFAITNNVAIAIAAGPVCEFKRSVVTNVEPDKIRGTELDDTQL